MKTATKLLAFAAATLFANAQEGSDCSAEVAACAAVVACATAPDEVALMGSPEGQALMVCRGAFDGAGLDECMADLFACAEAEACAAAWRAEDRHTPRDSGDATCTPEGRAWFVCRENADNHDVTCLGEYANCMLCDQACTDVVGRFPRSGGWQLPTQADIDASNVCVTPSAHRWPTVG